MPPEEIIPGAAPAAAEAIAAVETVAAPAVEATPESVVETGLPESAKPALHTDTETLLEAATKKPETKVEEVKPDAEKPAEEKPAEVKAEDAKPEETKTEEPKPEDAKPAEVKAPDPIVYEEFTLPNGVKPDAEKMGIYQEVLQKHRLPQEVGQELLNLHAEAIQAYANTAAEEQHRVFGDMRAGWRKQVMADDTLGGAGHQTAMKAVARARDALISSHRPGTPEYAADEKEFNDFLRITGAGDHPAMMRMLHNAARRLDEPAMPPTGIRPPPNNGAKPGKKGMRALYEKT